MDPVLLPFFNAQNDSERQQVIDHLLSEADAVVKDVVGYRFGVFFNRTSGRNAAMRMMFEARCSPISFRACAVLPAIRTMQILQFRNYVAAMSHRACHDFLRKKYPERAKLKNRIRYLLLHSPEFGIWEVEGDWLCGMKLPGRDNHNRSRFSRRLPPGISYQKRKTPRIWHGSFGKFSSRASARSNSMTWCRRWPILRELPNR